MAWVAGIFVDAVSDGVHILKMEGMEKAMMGRTVPK
jgi:hypothetical protein